MKNNKIKIADIEIEIPKNTKFNQISDETYYDIICYGISIGLEKGFEKAINTVNDIINNYTSLGIHNKSDKMNGWNMNNINEKSKYNISIEETENRISSLEKTADNMIKSINAIEKALKNIYEINNDYN